MSDSIDDDELFARELRGVEPLKPSDRVELKKPAASSSNVAYAREAAVTQRQQDTGGAREASLEMDYVSDDYVEFVKPTDTLSFKRAGIQEGVFRKLRLGKYPVEARLDLHRKTVVEARAELAGFIDQALRYDMRCLLILHGKGDRNPVQPAKLKSYVAKWLAESAVVMAYHSATVAHGGTGAVYVLLKKTERMKAHNREQHGSRG